MYTDKIDGVNQKIWFGGENMVKKVAFYTLRL